MAYQWETPLANWNAFAAGDSLLPQLAGTAGLGTITIDGEAIAWEIVAGLAAPEVVITVGAIAGAVALYYAWQSRRLITVTVDCGVHKNGTPNHAVVGVVTGTGTGTDFQQARLNAISDATANLMSQYGVGYHILHCNSGRAGYRGGF